MTARSAHIFGFDARAILIGGLCGGLAEIAWIAFYVSLMQTSASEVPRQITATVLPSFAGATIAPALGVAIHLALSIALAIVFASVAWQFPRLRVDRVSLVASALAALAAVWAVNFLVLLPQLNPAFVALLPPAVTLLSKLLFALAMGGVLAGAIPRPVRGAQSGRPAGS